MSEIKRTGKIQTPHHKRSNFRHTKINNELLLSIITAIRINTIFCPKKFKFTKNTTVIYQIYDASKSSNTNINLTHHWLYQSAVFGCPHIIFKRSLKSSNKMRQKTKLNYQHSRATKCKHTLPHSTWGMFIIVHWRPNFHTHKLYILVYEKSHTSQTTWILGKSSRSQTSGTY